MTEKEYFLKKGFHEDESGNLVLETENIDLYIDQNLIATGFAKDNEVISIGETKKTLESLGILDDFDTEELTSPMPSVKLVKKSKDLVVKAESKEIIDTANVDKLYEIFTFIPGSELEQGIEVEILTKIREVGEWIRRDASGNIVQKRPKFGCLVKTKEGVVKRLEFGRNLYSALVAYYITSDKKSKKVFIQRKGKGLETYYKVEGR